MFLGLGLTLTQVHPKTSKGDLPQDIHKCNAEPKEMRFSCYRSALDRHFTGDLEGFLKEVENNASISFESTDKSYAIFGTNCHTFYHAVGDFIATKSKTSSISQNLQLCPTMCTSGCIMGLYKREALASQFSEEVLKDFFQSCRQLEKKSCAHEIGHVLHDKYFYSILKILDGLSVQNYQLKLSQNYKYQTFEQLDLNAPFDECRKLVDEKYLPYCYTGVGHNLFLFSEFASDGYKAQFAECDNLKGANQEKCFAFLIYRIGINDVATKFLAGKFEEGLKTCDDAISSAGKPNLKFHCYVGLGGGLGLFIESEFLYSELSQDKIQELREQLSGIYELCEKAPKEFINDCYKGLLGTRFKDLYKSLNLHNPTIEKILPTIESDFEVVG